MAWSGAGWAAENWGPIEGSSWVRTTHQRQGLESDIR